MCTAEGRESVSSTVWVVPSMVGAVPSMVGPVPSTVGVGPENLNGKIGHCRNGPKTRVKARRWKARARGHTHKDTALCIAGNHNRPLGHALANCGATAGSPLTRYQLTRSITVHILDTL